MELDGKAILPTQLHVTQSYGDKDKVRSETIRQKTKVTDIVQKPRKLK